MKRGDWHAPIVAIGVLLAAGTAGWYYCAKIQPYRAFRTEYDEIRKLLHNLHERPPPGTDERQWEAACQIVGTQLGNICLTPDYVSLGEMRRLRDDIRREVADTASYERLQRIWDRFGETGAQGRKITLQFLPLLEEMLPDSAPAVAAMPDDAFKGDLIQIRAILSRVGESPPAEVPLSCWEEAYELTDKALTNVCWSTGRVSTAEMHRLREDVQRKMAETPSIEWLRWFWLRLGETGPYGKQFVDRYLHLFDEAAGVQHEPPVGVGRGGSVPQ